MRLRKFLVTTASESLIWGDLSCTCGDVADVVSLASKRLSKAGILLSVHKVALLAIESQASKLMVEALFPLTSDSDLKRVARIQLKAVELVSSRLAYKHVVSELALSGFDEIPKMPKLKSPFLASLLSDLKMTLSDPDISHKEKVRRAALAAASIANRAYTDMQLAVYAEINVEQMDSGKGRIEKVWVTQKDEKVCVYCGPLDGKVVAIESEFLVPDGLKVYQNLAGPPAHINCRCRLQSRVVK